MVALLVKNKDAFLSVMHRKRTTIDGKVRQRMRGTAAFITAHILQLTPVNTGRAIASYRWSVGSPETVNQDPIEIGSPFGTNTMALGTEPRRGPNEIFLFSSLSTLDFNNPYVKIFLSNGAPHIKGLEHGQLPDGFVFIPRSPQGMFGVTLEAADALARSGAFG
jgi:hypothetical protein